MDKKVNNINFSCVLELYQALEESKTFDLETYKVVTYVTSSRCITSIL